MAFVVQAVHERQQQIIKETESLQTEQSRFQRQLQDKEAEQQKLAEEEEFEQADALNSVIESLKQQTRTRADSLRALVSEAAALDRQREDGINTQVESLERIIQQLSALKKKHQKLYEKLVSESTSS